MFSWTLCFITNEKGAESSKFLKLFIHAPYSREMIIVDISLDCAGSDTSMGHSRQASATTFPHVSPLAKGDNIAKTVPVRCFSDGRVFSVFVPLPPAILTGFPQGASISWEAGYTEFSLKSAVFVVFHSRYQSTLIPVPPSKRPS